MDQPAAPVDTAPAADPTPAPASDPAVPAAPAAPAADPIPAPAAPVVPAAPVIPADPAPVDAPADDTPAGEPAGEDGEALPAPDHPDGKSYTEGYVKGLRTEAANYRTKLREAETRYDELLANLGKLGGFTSDDPAAPGGEGEPQDPAAALEAITAERDADRAKLRDYAQRDAVRSAALAGEIPADADALLDSTRFLSEIGQLDHNADDYAAQVAAALSSFVAANPRFASAPVVPQRSGGDPSQSAPESVQLTDDQFAALPAAERLQALEDGRYRP